tara:strand:- start:133 stop:438 length:306 start_codon:yes stop_codon:yes gene_type:complete
LIHITSSLSNLLSYKWVRLFAEVGRKEVITLSANLFETNVNIMAVFTEFQRETISMKKKTEEETNKGVKEKIEYEDDGLDYEDLYYDDSSDVDYGLEYTTT